MSGLGLQPVFPGDWEALQRNFERIEAKLGAEALFQTFVLDSGTTPEGSIPAYIGDKCVVRAGGGSATWWVKVADDGLVTGWRSVTTS